MVRTRLVRLSVCMTVSVEMVWLTWNARSNGKEERCLFPPLLAFQDGGISTSPSSLGGVLLQHHILFLSLLALLLLLLLLLLQSLLLWGECFLRFHLDAYECRPS